MCYVTSSYQDILICGDLNVDNLKDSNEKKFLFDLLEIFNLKYLLPPVPTRDCVNQTSSSIYYVLANNLNFKAKNIIAHKPQFVTLCSEISLTDVSCYENNYYKRFFDDQTIFQLNYQLSRTDLSNLYTIGDVDEDFFLGKFSILFSHGVPC